MAKRSGKGGPRSTGRVTPRKPQQAVSAGGENRLVIRSRPKHWGVWGWILGPVLPATEVQLGDATIVKLIGADLDRLRRLPRNLSLHVTGMKRDYQLPPAQEWVQSEWVARWTVEASSADDAAASVQGDLLPRLLATLNTLAGEPYRVELRRISPAVDGRISWKGQSPWLPILPTSMHFPVRAMTTTIEDTLRARYSALGSDAVAQKAAMLFRTAHHAKDAAQSDPLVAYAPLIGFQLCIEAIVSATGQSTLAPEARTEAEDAILAELKRRLAGEKSGAAAVRDARLALDALSNVFYRDQLVASARLLGIDEAIIDRLGRFYRFRNDHLGHPNSLLNEAIINEWLPEAAELARIVLSYYIDHLIGSNRPDVEPGPEFARPADEPAEFHMSWPEVHI